MTDERFALPWDASAPRLARHFVQEHAHGFPPSLVADAVLIVSELVTNAVQHGRPEIILHLHLDRDPPCIGGTIVDGGGGVPALPSVAAASDVGHGRGLFIVSAYASAWGVGDRPNGTGTSVWFRLEAS